MVSFTYDAICCAAAVVTTATQDAIAEISSTTAALSVFRLNADAVPGCPILDTSTVTPVMNCGHSLSLAGFVAVCCSASVPTAKISPR